MRIGELDHYNIITADLERSVAFYEQVLGFRNGERPDFGIPGAWLYSGARAVVHLISVDRNDKSGAGTIDHVAFRADDFDAARKTLKEKGVEFSEVNIPDFDLRQIFLHDPDGVKIELNFYSS